MNTPRIPELHIPASNADGAASSAGPALADAMQALRSQASSAAQQLAGDAAQLARGGADALRQRAVSLRDAGSGYIRERPIQAMLIAAGTGALVVLLASLLRNRGGTPR